MEQCVDPASYKKVAKREQDMQDDDDDHRRDSPSSQGEPSEVDVQFGEDGSFSTLGLDTVDEHVGRQETSVEMPAVVVRI